VSGHRWRISQGRFFLRVADMGRPFVNRMGNIVALVRLIRETIGACQFAASRAWQLKGFALLRRAAGWRSFGSS